MKRDDVFPSKYLKAADLGGKPLVVKIGSAPLETLKSSDGKEQQKIVLYFLGGTKKVLPINATNWDSVCDIAGDDTDNWPGNTIELYPAKAQLGGKTVDCIRIRAPQVAAAAPAPEAEGTAGASGGGSRRNERRDPVLRRRQWKTVDCKRLVLNCSMPCTGFVRTFSSSPEINNTSTWTTQSRTRWRLGGGWVASMRRHAMKSQ